jgi:putative addiction module killer protein
LRLERIEEGNLGKYKSVGSGVYELIIDVGPGYRVYFGKIGLQVVLLLCGGSKRFQQKDITKAKAYFLDYKIRSKNNG